MTPPSPSSGSMRSHAIGARGRGGGGCAPSTHVRRPCSARRAFDGVVTGSVESCDRSTSFGRPSFMTKSDWPTKAGVRPFFTGVRVPLGLGLTPLTSIDSSARRPLLSSSAKSEAARACSERLTTLTPPDLRDGVPCREPVRSIATPKPPQPKDRSSSAFGAASMAASAKRRTKSPLKSGPRSPGEALADAI